MIYCPNCGDRLTELKNFCPNCGKRITKSDSLSLFERSSFDDFFKDFKVGMPDINKLFKNSLSRDFEILDLTPEFFKKPNVKRSGFTIKMSRKNNEEPKFEVETFGNIDPNVIKSKIPIEINVPKSAPIEEDIPQKDAVKVAKEYTEPTAETRWVDDELQVAINLPEITQQSDIQVTQLEESIEIRAVSGKKGYFKIIQIPQGAKIVSEEFVPEKLILRIIK